MKGLLVRLISQTSREPEGARKRLSRGKYRKLRSPKAITFISLLLLLGALLPAVARASVFGDFLGFISGTAQAKSREEAPEPSGNLQTFALPAPAKNIDPTASRGNGDITIVGDSALMPAEGPVGTMADIEKPKNSTVSTYIVREGDTIASVAKMHNVSEGTILSANDLPRGATLKVGQELVILPIPGVKYTVKRGDTLESIAKATGGNVNEIAVHNSVDNSTLLAGAEIFIPNGEVSAIVPPTRKPGSAAAPSTAAPAKNNGYFKSPLASYRRTQGIHGYNGVDMGAPEGTSVRAAASGDITVARSGGWSGGYGSYAVISHPNGSQTLYAHMSGLTVSSGDYVSQGEVIGYVGHTGKVSGPTGNHLHFEIRNGPRNPF